MVGKMNKDEIKLTLRELINFIFHSAITKELVIEELGQVNVKEPKNFADFLNKVSNEFDKYFDVNLLKEFKNTKNKIKEDFEKRYNDYKFNSCDEKIIEFLSKPVKSSESVKTIVSSRLLNFFIFIIQVLNEVNNNNISNSLKSYVLMSLSLHAFEVTLHTLDRFLYHRTNNNEKCTHSKIKSFLDVDRNKEEHANLSQIEKVLGIVIEDESMVDKSTIFENMKKLRVLRNKIAHSQIYYDSGKISLLPMNMLLIKRKKSLLLKNIVMKRFMNISLN